MSRLFSMGRSLPRRRALVLALGMGIAGVAFGQATTGTIFGQAPAGDTVQITGASGINRSVTVNASGRYSVTLPLGTYTVTLMSNGQAVNSHKGVQPTVGSSTEVDFAAASASANTNAENLSAVSVSASALPPIDVTSTNQATVITSQQLKHLPLQRSGTAIALLAPGTAQGSGYFAGKNGESLVSFGGSSVTENAYYINGFNTTDPLSSFGGLELPYGSIEQQETITSGYDAKYGRSDGGVISQVGKRGTNEWHFGGQVVWRPRFADGDSKNFYYNNPRDPNYGALYQKRDDNKEWERIYDGYISGPLIKDKLFFFLSAEADKRQNNYVEPTGTNKVYYRDYQDPKFYGKLDWNINDSNILELTGVKNSHSYSSSVYNYDYNTLQPGAFNSYDQHEKDTNKLWVLHYTSYITDNLTFSALYGKQKNQYYTHVPNYPGYDPSLPNILGAGEQNPAYTGGHVGGITNGNTLTNLDDPTHHSSNRNLRLDLDWKLGDHDLQFGIDNQDVNDVNDGVDMSGPGYAWQYGQAPNPGKPISGTDPNIPPYVGASPDPKGYYVDRYVYITTSSARVKQRAQYIQDNWQVTDNFLLKLGLRNDQFTNYNPTGTPYIRLTKPQWAPRIGFSWDVNGDSTLKVFGNAGRYYLALPASVALRSAGNSTYTKQYYSYTGIDANGIPQGIKPIPENPVDGVSGNNEYGQPVDPRTAASTNIKSEYQDEFVLGMTQQINPSWVYGVTGTVRKLRNAIDDVGDPDTIYNKMIQQGIDPNTFNYSDIPGSILINPGRSNTFKIPKIGGGYYNVDVSPKDFGFPSLKRKYYSLELFLEHPWDGKWFGKVDYVFSRSYGNTEGQVRSDIGQTDVSATEDWDFGQLMEYSNGYLSNDQKHVLKAYGTYQIAPEWSVSGNLQIASGHPRSCLGYYGAGEQDLNNYGESFHYCGGQPSPPGKVGFNPWTHILSLSAEYRPQWADKKLGFQVLVYNVFNEQKVTQVDPSYGSTSSPDPDYQLPLYEETPRYLQLSVSYDW